MISLNIKLEEKELEKILDFRHHMHQYPEISNQEFETTKNIKSYLKKIEGVEVLDLPVATGLVAKIKTNKSGKVVGLRCDIDAISQTEEYESPYKSKIPGVMHACGHDFHTAALLGATTILAQNRSKLKGDVILLFQKAEETTTGAKEMIDAGLFEKTKAEMFFGLHNWPHVPVGKVILKNGALMAAKTNFKIKIIGRGGHGSMPHLNIDPIVCASATVMSLQTVLSRNIDPLDSMVFSVNSIIGGSVDNLVVDDVKLTATIRSLSSAAIKRAKERMEKIVADTCSAYECQYEIEYVDDIPLTFNSEEMYKIAYQAAKEVVGEENLVNTKPSLASEDFAFIMEKVPAFMYWFGSAEDGEGKEALHSKYFHASDQGIKTAAEVLANSVIKAQEN